MKYCLGTCPDSIQRNEMFPVIHLRNKKLNIKYHSIILKSHCCLEVLLSLLEVVLTCDIIVLP